MKKIRLLYGTIFTTPSFMNDLLGTILLFSLIPVGTLLAGGAIATFKRPGASLRSTILHFAAGVVFSVVAVEILPTILKERQPVPVIVGFTLGVVAMLLIRKFAGGHGEEEGKVQKEAGAGSKALPMSLLLPIGIDIFIDGLLLGIGFSAGETAGMLLAIALAIELLSLGMATATELGNKELPPKKILLVVAVLAAIFFGSAVLGGTLLHNLTGNALEIVLSFGLAALLFLVTEELLTEAHEEPETVWQTAAFFAGFLLFLILGMVA